MSSSCRLVDIELGHKLAWPAMGLKRVKYEIQITSITYSIFTFNTTGDYDTSFRYTFKKFILLHNLLECIGVLI